MGLLLINGRVTIFCIDMIPRLDIGRQPPRLAPTMFLGEPRIGRVNLGSSRINESRP